MLTTDEQHTFYRDAQGHINHIWWSRARGWNHDQWDVQAKAATSVGKVATMINIFESGDYFDCLMTAGYYGVFNTAAAQHTYAFAEAQDNTYGFPCYGGFARYEGEYGNKKVVYPASLWTPSIFNSKNLGTQFTGNLYVALGIARFTLDPGYDYTIKDWEDWWKTHYQFSPTCNAGIVYGVMGVCHQVCNRILLATKKDSITSAPVNWPPSQTFTYWIYGFRGMQENLVLLLASKLIDIAVKRKAAMNDGELRNISTDDFSPETMSMNLLSDYLSDKNKALESRKQEATSMLDNLKAKENLQQLNIGALTASDARFNALKHDLDCLLIRGDVSSDEYANKINTYFNVMLNEFKNIMTEHEFQSMFGASTDIGSAVIIQRNIMPDSYDDVKRQVKF